MAKDWWFKFEWDDWLGDDELMACTLETQGFWIKCIALMNRAGVSELTGTVDQMRRKFGILPEELMRCVHDLKTNSAANVRFGNGDVSIISRRRQREVKANADNRLYVARHREKVKCKGGVREQSKSIDIEKEIREEKEKKKSVAEAAPPEPERRESSVHPVIIAIHEVTGRYPPREIYDDLINRLGFGIEDLPRLKQCFIKWRARGYNKVNYDWIEWYHEGIPKAGKQNGTNKQHHTDKRETTTDRLRDTAAHLAAKYPTEAQLRESGGDDPCIG